MQVSAHAYAVHIPDTAAAHPGGSNIFFAGDPSESMVIVDTGEHDREWTRQILDGYEELGRPPITAIAITHAHSDHIGGLDRIFEVVQAPVRCHPKLAGRLGAVVGAENVERLRSGERIRACNGVNLTAIFTPGHEEAHVCYYMARDRAMFTGDTVLGGSSSTVQDLSDYMNFAGEAVPLQGRGHLSRSRPGGARAPRRTPHTLVHPAPHRARGAGAVRSAEGHHRRGRHGERHLPAEPEQGSAQGGGP